MTDILLTGVVMGLLATPLMDLWALLLNKIAGQPAPNWAMPGRWAAHLCRGTIFHNAISESEQVRGELQIGWVFHYAVGTIYGVALALILGPSWLAQPSLLPAWLFSILTVGFGWFLLQPGMGLGWAASKTENPWKVRSMNLLAHTVFGLGLWVGALLLG